MAGFQVANFNFGEKIEENNIKRQQLAQRAAQANQQAALQARAQDIGAANAQADRDLRQQQMDESARQFDTTMADRTAARDESARQFDVQSQQKDREFAAQRKDKAFEQSWTNELNSRKMDEMDANIARFMSQMDAYDVARQKDELALKELQEQAKAKKEMLDTNMAQAILACEKEGGVLGGGSLGVLNANLKSINPDDPGFDFVGSCYVDPKTGERKLIGDGSKWYLGQFKKDKNGNVQYGDDGTPLTTMIPINEGYRRTVLSSKYGKAYLEGQPSELDRARIRNYDSATKENEAQAALYRARANGDIGTGRGTSRGAGGAGGGLSSTDQEVLKNVRSRIESEMSQIKDKDSKAYKEKQRTLDILNSQELNYVLSAFGVNLAQPEQTEKPKTALDVLGGDKPKTENPAQPAPAEEPKTTPPPAKKQEEEKEEGDKVVVTKTNSVNPKLTARVKELESSGIKRKENESDSAFVSRVSRENQRVKRADNANHSLGKPDILPSGAKSDENTEADGTDSSKKDPSKMNDEEYMEWFNNSSDEERERYLGEAHHKDDVNRTKSANERHGNGRREDSGKSKGRASHEGVSTSFAKTASKTMADKEVDDEIRRKRIDELARESKEEQAKWAAGGRRNAFRFSKQDELDELVLRANSARQVIENYRKRR